MLSYAVKIILILEVKRLKWLYQKKKTKINELSTLVRYMKQKNKMGAKQS